MTLLDEVISQASDGDATAMLRKLMIVAHRLKAKTLFTWVQNELNGYKSPNELPSYRGPKNAVVQAVITGPMGGKGTNTLSSIGVPDGYEHLFKVYLFDPLAGIESLASSPDNVGVPWDPAAVGLYNGWIQEGKVAFLELWGVYSATRMISQSTLRGVVDIVRTTALEMALDLQSEYPDAGEVDGPTVQDPAVNATVMHITNNIYGSVTGLAQGNEVRQKVAVEVGDLVGALTVARAFLSNDAIADLSRIFTEPGSETEKRRKLERFVHAIRGGTVSLAGGVASNLAAEGVMDLASQFFGWVAGL